MKKIVTLCTLLALWTGAMAESLSSVSYYDPALEGDNKMTTTPDGVEVTVLDGTETEIEAGWYTISQNVSFDHTLVIKGDVALILADGTQTKMEQADGSPLPYTGIAANNAASPSELYSLTIYTQSIGENAGRLGIRTNQHGIYTKEVAINGAVLDISYNALQSGDTRFDGIFAMQSLNLTDAKVTIAGPTSGNCTPYFSPSGVTPMAITRSTLTITGAAKEAICLPNVQLTIADSKVITSGSDYGIHAASLDILNSEITASGGKSSLFSDSYVAITDSRVTATGLGALGYGIMSNTGDMTIEGGEVTCSGYYGIYASGNLGIKGATVECSTSYTGMLATRNLTIDGGKVTASGNTLGLYASTLNIEGGQVELTGGEYGVYAKEAILGWTRADDYIRINTFYPECNPTFAEGKRFIAEGLGIATLDTDEGGYLINGHTLYPLDGYLLTVPDGVRCSATRQGTTIGSTLYNNIAYNIFQPGDVVTIVIPEGMPVASNDVTIGSDGTFTMPDADVAFLFATPYLDPTAPEGEQQKIAPTNPLTSGTTSLNGGWYEVNGNVTLTSTLTLNGDVNIILDDGASLSIELADAPIEGTGILGKSHTLTIYTQSIGENAGRLGIRANQHGINVKEVSINGAVLDISYNALQSYETLFSGITGINSLNLTDAHVTISGPASGRCSPFSSPSGHTPMAITRSTLTITGAAVEAICFPMNNLTITDSKVITSGSSYGIHAKGLDIRNSEITASGGKSSLYSSSYVAITGSRVTATGLEASGFGILSNDGDITIEGGEITCSGDRGIYASGNLGIKGATVECSSSYIGIYVSSNLTIEGGKVTASGNTLGLKATNLNIEGGQVELTGGEYDVYTNKAILGWTRADDYIQASNFYEEAAIEADKAFVIDGTSTILKGTISDHSILSGNPTILRPCLVLGDADDNIDTIAEGADLTAANQPISLALDGRTLYKDGHWNTLCLPFDLTLAGSVLDGDGVQLMTFDNASLNDGTLSLDFSQANAIQSGVPYLIKWNNTGQHLANPVFQGVILDAAAPAEKAVQIDGVIRFEGCYAPLAISEDGDNTKLFMGDADQLYYPNGAMTIGSQRAYFQLADGITCSDLESEPGEQSIRAFLLNFGDESTGIREIHNPSNFLNPLNPSNPLNPLNFLNPSNPSNPSNSWFTPDGRRLNAAPTVPGLYLHNGCKVLIK